MAGSKYEALDGENVTMRFKTKLDRVDEVKIIFEGENKGKMLFAKYCFRETDPVCDIKSDHLQVEEGNVSLILLKVNSSRTGLYEVQAFFGKDVDEVKATLVVNKPPISSSPAPPQTSTSKPPNSSEYQGLLITGVIIISVVIIVVLASHYFWEHRRVLSFKKQKDWERLHTETVYQSP